MDEKAPTPEQKTTSSLQAVGMVWEIFAAIALPTVLFAIAGRWLDRRFNSSPWFLVIGLFCALTVSGIIVVRIGKRMAKKM